MVLWFESWLWPCRLSLERRLLVCRESSCLLFMARPVGLTILLIVGEWLRWSMIVLAWMIGAAVLISNCCLSC